MISRRGKSQRRAELRLSSSSPSPPFPCPAPRLCPLISSEGGGVVSEEDTAPALAVKRRLLCLRVGLCPLPSPLLSSSVSFQVTVSISSSDLPCRAQQRSKGGAQSCHDWGAPIALVLVVNKLVGPTPRGSLPSAQEADAEGM